MESQPSAESDTAVVTLTVGDARPVDSKTLSALVDVDVQLSGLSFPISSVQARRLPDGDTSVHLPTFRDTDGHWRPAIQLPQETRGLLVDAVLAFLVEENLARPRLALQVVDGEDALAPSA